MDLDKGGRLALLIIGAVIGAIIVAGVVHVVINKSGKANAKSPYYELGYRIGTSSATNKFAFGTQLASGRGHARVDQIDCRKLATQGAAGTQLSSAQLDQWLAGCLAGARHVDSGR